MRFEDKTIVITGGSSGIGRGAVDLFLREGAKVVMGDIDNDEGLAMMSSLGHNFHFQKCDVTQEDQVKSLMDSAAETTGGIDIVFNSAGAVAYFASDAAGFVTGTHLLVDGGLLVGTQASWDPEVPGMLDALLPEPMK